MRIRTAHFCLLFLALWVFPSSALETIPVKLIGGRVIAKGDMKGPAGEVPVHLLVDLGAIDPLVVHKGTYEMMGVTDDRHLDLTFASTKLPGVEVFMKEDFRELEELTRQHASELEEVPVSGILGLGALGEDAIQLDLNENAIRRGRLDEMARSDRAVAVGYEQTGQGLRFRVNSSDGSSVQVQFSTRQFECLANFDSIKSLRIGTESPATLLLGESNLIRYGAYRPTGMPGIARPAPDLILGIELLSHFRVTIDQQEKKLYFDRISDPANHDAEQAYFISSEDGNADRIEQFLTSNPDSWLKGEAAAKLLEMRLGDVNASTPACEKAMDLFAASLPTAGRAQQLLMIADQVLGASEGRELAILRKSLDLASQSAGKDLNGAAVHQLNARKGLLAMREGDLRQARRLLLSAAFGIPGDPNINLWMGEYYVRAKQPVRAWSRFVEAAMAENPPPAAIRELEALYRDERFRQDFPVSEAELLLEGRIPTFSPARQREESETPSIQLIELFATGSNKGAVGPQLAWDGLRQFFDGAPVVFLSYHLDGSLGNAAGAARYKLYSLMSPLGVICDGTAIDLDGADETAAQKLFDKYLPKTLGSPVAKAVAINAAADRTDRQIHLKLALKHNLPASELENLRVYALLAERCVFAMGENGLALHYNVVRGSLVSPEGVPVAELSEAIDLGTTLDEISPKRKTTQPSTTQALDAKGPPWMRAGEPDLRECSVVVIVQNAKSWKVLAAAQVPLKEVQR